MTKLKRYRYDTTRHSFFEYCKSEHVAELEEENRRLRVVIETLEEEIYDYSQGAYGMTNTDKFLVIMARPISSDYPSFCHPADNARMYIAKNGVKMELNQEEIKKVVRSAGGSFRR